MTAPVEHYPFLPRDPALGAASLAPLLPITLLGTQPLSVRGLLDTGAAVNVLPYYLEANSTRTGTGRRRPCS